ncbi:MAG: hypothetical protein ACK56I_35085, partial [bacterium]
LAHPRLAQIDADARHLALALLGGQTADAGVARGAERRLLHRHALAVSGHWPRGGGRGGRLPRSGLDHRARGRGLGRGLGPARPHQLEALLAQLGELLELLVAQHLIDAGRGPYVLGGAAELPVEPGRLLEHRGEAVRADRDQHQAADHDHFPETDAEHGRKRSSPERARGPRSGRGIIRDLRARKRSVILPPPSVWGAFCEEGHGGLGPVTKVARARQEEETATCTQSSRPAESSTACRRG